MENINDHSRKRSRMATIEETKLKAYCERVVSKPFWGRLKQGTIFSSAATEDCRPSVCGIIITAHCDLANQKVSSVTYLPVIPFKDWCKSELASILCKNLSLEINNKINKWVEDSGVDPMVLVYEGLTNVIEKHYSPKLPDRKVEQFIEKLQNEQNKICEVLQIAKHTPISDHEITALREFNTKMFDKHISDCVEGKMSEFYFLPAVSVDDEVGAGYVVLLRNIHNLPIKLADAVANGLDIKRFSELADVNPAWRSKLSITCEDDFSMPIGQLSSPHLEHLMQSFSNLYVRIGLENVPAKMIEKISTSLLGA
jgi:hypothetical protein